mgnify:FL=1
MNSRIYVYVQIDDDTEKTVCGKAQEKIAP